IGHIGPEHLFLCMFSVLPEPVDNKKCCRSDHGTKGDHGVDPEREPDKAREDDRDEGEEPDPVPGKKALPAKAEVLVLQEEPVQEEKEEKCPAAYLENRGGLLDRGEYPRVARECGSK